MRTDYQEVTSLKNSGLPTSIVSKWHENCSLFRFLSSQSAKKHLFCPTEFYEPPNTKSLHFDGIGWGCCAPLPVFRCSVSLLQMRNQFSSDFHFRIFEFLLLLLWWYTPVFMMIYSYFYDEVDEYRLNPHGYSFDFVSDVDCNIFQPRIQNFQAEKIIVSSRENFMLNMRILVL